MKLLILSFLVAAVYCCLPSIAGEVDVYLLGGQSNMEGQGAITDLTEEQKQFPNNVYFWNGAQF